MPKKLILSNIEYDFNKLKSSVPFHILYCNKNNSSATIPFCACAISKVMS